MSLSASRLSFIPPFRLCGASHPSMCKNILCIPSPFSHGRDNDLHVWDLANPTSTSSASADSTSNPASNFASSTSSNTSNAQIVSLPPSPLPSSLLQSLPIPTKTFSLKVNSLNFCRFSAILLPQFHGSGYTNTLKSPGTETKGEEGDELLIAVPNTLAAEFVSSSLLMRLLCNLSRS